MFSYSGRVKSPEWRQQLRRADLRQFQIFRHGPIIIYTRLPAGGTYYPICMFPMNSECLIGISDAFSAFVYGYPSSCPHAHCTPNKSVPTLRYTRRHGPVHTGLACRHLLSAFPWISEDCLLSKHLFILLYRQMRSKEKLSGYTMNHQDACYHEVSLLVWHSHTKVSKGWSISTTHINICLHSQ